MRRDPRPLLAFFAGFAAGMLFLLVLMWHSGTIRPVRAATNPIRTMPAPLQTPPEPPQAEPGQSMAAEVPDLIVPVAGVDISKMTDTFNEGRGNHRHQATDIMAPRGTPVLAAGDGTIVKLFLSRAGGITIYQFDPTRTWCYYYAHLDRYAPGIMEGMAVRKGQTIGYVGSTGDASPSAPHLHFEISLLGPEKHWWRGTPINPYPILMRHARR
jgi:murein DD-endopeptidase MepM/ murein hydrolase activator NlpD